jgi:hypothetical protein
MPRVSLRRRVAMRLAAVRRAIVAPPGNAIGRLAWRCRRRGVRGTDLEILGAAILARLQEGIIKVEHGARPVEPAVEVPDVNPATIEVPTVEVPSMAEPLAPAAVIYAWPQGPEAVDGRLLSLRAWLDYMRERGRLSPHECTRLSELGRAPEGIQYLIRLRDYYDGTGPYPGDPLAEPVLRTGTAA